MSRRFVPELPWPAESPPVGSRALDVAAVKVWTVYHSNHVVACRASVGTDETTIRVLMDECVLLEHRFPTLREAAAWAQAFRRDLLADAPDCSVTH